MLPEPDDRRGQPYVNGQGDDPPELDAKAQTLLGQALQAHYDDLVNAPIPDRLLMLLVQLEAAERDGQGTSNGTPRDE